MSTHAHYTPTPWKVTPLSHRGITAGQGKKIADLLGKDTDMNAQGISREESKANAAHIVHCVNLHAEIVNALHDMVFALEPSKIEAALSEKGFTVECFKRARENAKNLLKKAGL